MKSLLPLLHGKKTKVAALLAALLALNHLARALGWPNLNAEAEQAALEIAAALGLYGLRHAIERHGQPAASEPEPEA